MRQPIRNGLGALSLRVGLGTFLVLEGWPNILAPAKRISVLHALHFIAPGITGRSYSMFELCGGVLLLIGLLTRSLAFMFALGLALEIAVAKRPILRLEAWAPEWLALWMALSLLAVGGGVFSVDRVVRNHRDVE